MTATLARADRIPVLTQMEVRAMSQNSTISMPVGRNVTRVDDESIRHYNTVKYRAYVGFLVIGIVIAVIFPFVFFGPSLFHCYRRRQEYNKAKERKADVEIYVAKMCAMTQPTPAVLRPERAG
jgi:hypothetical protein